MTVYGLLKEQFEKEIAELKRQLSLANSRRHESQTHCTKVLTENTRYKEENADLTSRIRRFLQCAQCTVLNEHLFPDIPGEDGTTRDVSGKSPRGLSRSTGDLSAVKKQPATLKECIEGYRTQLFQKCSELRECEARIEDRNLIIATLQQKIRDLEQFCGSLQEQIQHMVPAIPENMDISRVLVQQLENANLTIHTQADELNRLREAVRPELAVENLALRTQLMQIQENISLSQSRIIEQEELLADMHMKIENLSGEKKKLKERCKESEEKYRSVKSAHKQLMMKIEKDLDAPCAPFNQNTPSDDPLEIARLRYSEERIETTPLKRTVNTKDRSNDVDSLHARVADMEREIETERKRGDSLMEDLDTVRKMFIEKEAVATQFEQDNRNLELRLQKIETENSNLRSDLEAEGGRARELMEAVEELETLLCASREECLSMSMECVSLREHLAGAQHQVTVYDSKLYAQGLDLVETKRALQQIQMNRDGHSMFTSTPRSRTDFATPLQYSMGRERTKSGNRTSGKEEGGRDTRQLQEHINRTNVQGRGRDTRQDSHLHHPQHPLKLSQTVSDTHLVRIQHTPSDASRSASRPASGFVRRAVVQPRTPADNENTYDNTGSSHGYLV